MEISKRFLVDRNVFHHNEPEIEIKVKKMTRSRPNTKVR